VRVGDGAPGSHPFLEALTGHEWVLTLRFRVPRNTFRADALERSLRLVPFADSATPVLSDAPRLDVVNVGVSQEVAITAHADDLGTPAFDEFLRRAVEAARGGHANGEAFGDWKSKLAKLKS
jgi:hypothetical protein